MVSQTSSFQEEKEILRFNRNWNCIPASLAGINSRVSIRKKGLLFRS